MNVEIHCTQCRTAYVLDDSFPGASMPCPSCGAPEGLVVPAKKAAPREIARTPGPAPNTPKETPVAPAPSVPAAPNPVPTARPRATVPAPAAPASRGSLPTAAIATKPTPATDGEHEVVCPRCKLHFVPRKGQIDRTGTDRRSVLVVEAMEYFREIAADALAEQFEVKQAASVDEARTILAAGGVDLIILDPESGGIELLHALGSKRCPILIYTDRDESDIYGETWEQLRRYGADDIVMKGMNAGESLARKVAGLLGVRLVEDE